MSNTDRNTHIAPCGQTFYFAANARSHEMRCDQCAGATEAHETEGEMTEGEMTVFYDQLTANDETAERWNAMRRHPSHAGLSAMFDRMHEANRATIDNLTAMADRALEAGNLPAARDLLHRIRSRQTANARIEACWTVKS